MLVNDKHSSIFVITNSIVSLLLLLLLLQKVVQHFAQFSVLGNSCRKQKIPTYKLKGWKVLVNAVVKTENTQVSISFFVFFGGCWEKGAWSYFKSKLDGFLDRKGGVSHLKRKLRKVLFFNFYENATYPYFQFLLLHFL